MLKGRVWAALGVAASLLLAGCSSPDSGEASPAPSSTSDAPDATAGTVEPPKDDDTLRVEYVEQMAHLYNIENPPDVAFVREVEDPERLDVVAACMQDHGFATKVAAGGLQHDYPTDQAQAWSLASFECDVAYPPPVKYLRPLTDDQARIIYAHLRDEALPCLETQGVKGVELPSEEKYLSQFREGGLWDPLAEVDPSAANRMLEICSLMPPSDVLYAE